MKFDRAFFTQHLVCLIAAWVIGPYFATWIVEGLVLAGTRGDFTWFDPLMRLIFFVVFEFAWFYATGRLTQFRDQAPD